MKPSLYASSTIIRGNLSQYGSIFFSLASYPNVYILPGASLAFFLNPLADSPTFCLNHATDCFAFFAFEADLKKKPLRWWAWTRLQDMQRWVAGRQELEDYIFATHEENKNLFDKSVANAMANENLEMSVKKNT